MIQFIKSNFFKNFELYIGSIFISITVCIVILNVFTRYVLNFTFFWAEEISVGCFVWTIFLGTSAAYRKKGLIGVEVLIKILPAKYRPVISFFTSILLGVICAIMFFFSYTYVSSSTKITPALEMSYIYINSGIVISFFLMTLYSIGFIIENFKKTFLHSKEND